MPSPPPPNIIQQGSLSHHGPWSFQKNCVQCTITHCRCIFDVNNQSCCKRCTKRGLSCAFKSSQGRRNDLFTVMMEASNLLSMSLKVSPPISLVEASTATKIPLMAFVTCTEASTATISPSTAEVTCTKASRATISPSTAEVTSTEASTATISPS